MNNVLIPIFVGLFMLMAGVIVGNPSDRSMIKENNRLARQTATDIAVIKAQIRFAHGNEFNFAETKEDSSEACLFALRQ